MSEDSKTTRLSKAAREFNVGITTIVETLLKKGFEIETKPNTKLTPEMYAILSKEFQKEKDVKEVARQKDIGKGLHTTIVLDELSPKERDEEEFEDDFKEPDVMITDVSPGSLEEKPVVSKQEKKEETKTVAEEEKKEVVEKVVEEEKETKPPKQETEEKKVKEEKEVTEEKEVEEEITRKTDEEKKTEEVPEEEGQLKVLGKIDLEKINQKTKPSKKSKSSPATTKKDKKEEPAAKKEEQDQKEEKEKKKETEKPAEKPAEKEKKEVDKKEPEKETERIEAKEEKIKEGKTNNFLPTEVEKLSGPKILDKIDLPEVKKTAKKPVASSKDEKVVIKKKKRRRISPVQKDSRDKRGEKDGPKSKKPSRKSKREVKRPELSEEDIQKQIRETLSRLNPTGKSKASKHRRTKRAAVSQSKLEEEKKLEEESKIIKVTEFVTVNELATMMDVPPTDVISACMSLGLFVSINQRLDAETLTVVAEEFGYQVEFVSVEVQEAIDHFDDDYTDDDEEKVERSPIITVMGHVDHGKTKLLDYIRRTNVVAGEAGGITQHIGAYEVTLENGKSITFLDTPGHEAFTAMRARGAKITDVAIIVIAADDNVMPQTKEAINHALAANVPIVFAINKIDKPNANVDQIKQKLADMDLLVEDWGGKYQSQEISAKNGINIDELLEKVLLESELLELKGNPNRLASGTVIESSLDKGRGYVAKILVQNGTLNIGDVVLAGSYSGRVKAMYNERNQSIKEAGPSTPLLMLGLSGAPQAGDGFNVMKDEREARNIATKRQQLQREQGIRTQKHITLDEIGRRIAIGDFKELNLIVKGDVDGSVEALSDSLLKLSTNEVQVNVIHRSVGAITETDVLLASASEAIIVGFQVRPSPSARKLAEQEQIDIRLYSIIYQAIDEIKAAIEGMLAPEYEEKITSNLEIRDVFKISKVGTVAGCYVLDGKINRKTKVRIIRNGIVVYTGHLGSLKRFKDDVKEVQAGYECGLNIENFNDIKVGDIIEGYEEVEVKRKL